MPETDAGRMVVAGNERLLLTFAALGFEAAPCSDGAELSRTLEKLRSRRDVYLVVCGEGQARQATEAVQTFRRQADAVLLTLPDSAESLGLDRETVRKEVERATGADLLGKEEKVNG